MARLIQKAKNSSIYTLFGNACEQLAGIVIVWLLVTKLSVEEFGIYNLLLGTSAFLSIVSSFGLITTFQRYLPDFFQKKEYRKFSWTVRFGMAFRIVAAIVFISIILLLFDKIGPFFKIGDYFTFFLLFAFGSLFLLQANLLQRVMEAMFLHKYVVYAHIVHTLTRLSLLCVIFYLGYGLFQVLLVDIVTYSVLLGLCYHYYRVNFDPNKEKEKDASNFSKSDLLKKVFRYSGFSLFNQAGRVFLNIAMGFFIISHYLGPAALGYYAFAARIGRLISKWLPSRALKKVVKPVFFARYAEFEDKTELNKMFQFLSKLNLFLILPVFTLVALFGSEIIQYVFDFKYLTVYPVMLILFVHYIMLAFPVAISLETVEKPELILIGKLSSIYSLIMGIILIQFWGILGVAVATSSAIILKKGFEYTMAKKYAGITFPWMGVFKICLNCFAFGILMVWAKQFVNGILSLTVVCILSSFLYLGISYVNKPFLQEERSLINKMIGKAYFVF
jgi:O-antigen/teichoic acid export membrane protein